MKISVFITSYNQKEYLIEAIDSVINQTLKPFEIIVVDDCSSDGSQAVIQDYADRYPGWIRPFCHSENLGISRNKAFAQKQAQGDWLTYLDGDDRYLPDKLRLEAETLEKNPEAKIVFSDFYAFNAKGKRMYAWADESEPPSGYVFKEVFGRQYPRRVVFRYEMVNYDCLKQVGFYDEERKTHEDWDLRIRLTKRFPVAYCPVPLSEYRRHNASITKTLALVSKFHEVLAVYEKNRPLMNDLPKKDQQEIDANLAQFFAMKASQIVRDFALNGDRLQALQWYLKSLKWMSPDMALKDLMYMISPVDQKAANRKQFSND